MANEEHLAIMKQGIKAWNAWLLKNQKVAPDLSGADLSGADLSGAILSWADLRGADLSEAKLMGADLSEAKLMGADLSGANLSGAYLIGADLNRANLSEANLSGADLKRADLSYANLYNAITEATNFSGAKLTTPLRFLIEVDSNIAVEQLGALLGAISKLHNLARIWPPRIEKIAIGHEVDEPVYYEEDWQR
ncbi:MAG: pentapeptide repeat-containing protein [Planctomycetota bacterium]|jgi:hypothetical protein